MNADAKLAELVNPASAPDAAAGPLLDRQLRLLGELAEIGLEIARALEAQAKGTGPKVTGGDIAHAYARVSRAVRQAILLQSRLIGDAETRRATVKAEADKSRQERQDSRKAAISFAIERIAEAQHDDAETVEGLTEEANDRLDDEGFLGDVLDRPMSEIVAQICRRLGLDPDWTRLAEEAWAKAELGSGEVGRPLMAWSSARLLPCERQRTAEASAKLTERPIPLDTG
jgi:hypothetical protein